MSGAQKSTHCNTNFNRPYLDKWAHCALLASTRRQLHSPFPALQCTAPYSVVFVTNLWRFVRRPKIDTSQHKFRTAVSQFKGAKRPSNTTQRYHYARAFQPSNAQQRKTPFQRRLDPFVSSTKINTSHNSPLLHSHNLNYSRYTPDKVKVPQFQLAMNRWEYSAVHIKDVTLVLC